jgi:hypothetical protein
MGTRADFFVGTGPTAEWIGSTSFDGHPESWGAEPLTATTEAEFRAAVEKMLSKPRDGGLFTRPEEGWPWPWNNFLGSDYAYAWDPTRGAVASCGKEWVTVEQLRNDSGCIYAGRELSDEEVPDMSKHKKADVLAKSGLVFIVSKEQP